LTRLGSNPPGLPGPRSPPPEGPIKIVHAALGDDAGILGAALLAREHFVHS